jgi:TRAP-type C4-dicarboxylate transport system permease small subunit
MVDRFLALERGAVVWTRRLALGAGWLLLAVAVVTVADALLRTFLSRPIQGTFEATELILAAIIFLAMPYTGLTDGHVSVDLLTSRLGPRAQSLIVAANALVCAVVLGFIAWEMGLLAAEYGRTARTTITMRIPIFPFILPVAVAAWLAAACFVVQAMGAGLRALHPRLAPAGAGEARPR